MTALVVGPVQSMVKGKIKKVTLNKVEEDALM